MEGKPPEGEHEQEPGESGPGQPEPPDSGRPGWLPPQPPGGAPPGPPPGPPRPQPPPPPQFQPPPPPPQFQPVPPAPPPGQPAPGQPPPAAAPPGQPPPPAYPPPQYPYPYPQQYPPPVYQPLPPQPPNNDAVIGFTCAVIGGVLLFFSAGLSTIISLILGIVAIPYSRKGKKKVESGETRKHKDLANAGYVTGIIVTILSVLAIVVWTLIIALVDWDEVDDSSSDDPDDFEFHFRTGARVAAGLFRLLG